MLSKMHFLMAGCLSPLLFVSISCGGNSSASSESDIQESASVVSQPPQSTTPSPDEMTVEACSISRPGDCVPRNIPSPVDLVTKAAEEAKNLVAKLGLDNWQAGIIDAIAKPTAAVVKDDAEKGGWTKESCLSVGGVLIGSASLAFQAPMCGAIGAGVGTPACMLFLAANAGAVTKATCNQLCNDHHLQDCK